MKEEDGEIRVGESRFYLGEDNIIYETIVGDFDEQNALGAREAIYKLADKANERTKMLIDLDEAGNQSYEARKIVQELFDTEVCGKIALFGLHPVARVTASFVIGASKKKDIRFFKTMEGALAWLKEE